MIFELLTYGFIGMIIVFAGHKCFQFLNYMRVKFEMMEATVKEQQELIMKYEAVIADRERQLTALRENLRRYQN